MYERNRVSEFYVVLYVVALFSHTKNHHYSEFIPTLPFLSIQALSMSSEDNMTGVVVPFGSWGKYTKSASMFYSFGIGRDMNKSSRFG